MGDGPEQARRPCRSTERPIALVTFASVTEDPICAARRRFPQRTRRRQNGGSAGVLPDPCLSLRVVRPVVGAEADLSASCATGLLEATTAGPGERIAVLAG